MAILHIFGKNFKRNFVMTKKVAENQVVKTNRQKLTDRMRERYPELNIDDDEALSGQISTDYDLLDQRNKEREDFNNMLANNPHGAGIVTGMATGKNEDGTDFDLGEYLLDNYPEIVIDLIEGNPKNKERYAQIRADRDAAKKADDEFNAKKQELVDAEDAELDAAIKEAGLKTEEVKDLIDWIYNPETGFIKRARDFGLTKQDFLQLFRIKDWDAKMAEADNKGYVRGKNEKIDMQEHKHAARTKLPVLNGGGGKPKQKDDDPTLNNLDKMKDAYTL